MDVLKSVFFISCCMLFIAHQLLQKVFYIRIAIADNYLDNLLCMPVILSLLLAERKLLFRFGNIYRLSTSEIVITTLYVSLISEFIFPLLSSKFTFDWFDFFFFFAGTGLYTLFSSHSQKQETVPCSR